VASGNQIPAPLTPAPTFELKRFAWATPDRLELSGTFGGMQDAPADAAPMLVVRAGDRVHRLPAVPDSLSGPPEDGKVWQAHFAWQDAPVAFDVAELQLGAGLVVELPEPGAKRRLLRAQVLEVRAAQARGADARRETIEIVRAPGPPAEVTREREIPDGGAPSVGSQVELLSAQEEVRELRVAMQLTEAELTRAREDLRAERERRAGDSERFREGLAKVRESAEKALAAEQSATQRLGTELREAREAIEAKDAALETLRGQLEAAAAAQTQAEAKAREEAEALRKHVAKLESDAKDTERLRAELERSRARADAARTELEKAYGSVDQARSDAERVLGRLTAIRAN
jgi:hypothetical protein